MTNTVRHNHSADHSELLSSYLDNAVSLVERREAEALLKSCEACAAELADLRSLQAALRALPAPMPRRSFTIDPHTVRPRRLLFPIFRTASFATALLLFILIGVNVVQSPRAGTATGGSAAPQAAQQAEGYSASGQEGAGTAMESAPTIPALAEDAPDPNGPQSNVSPGLAPTAMAAARGAAGAAAEAAPAPTEAAAAALQAPTPASEAAMPEAADAATEATSAAAAGAAHPNDEYPVAGAAREAIQVPAPPPGGAGGDAAGLAYPAGDAGGGAAGGDMPIEQAPQPETGAADTRTLQAPEQPGAQPASLTPLRIAQYLVALALLGLGLATWWTARRGI